MNKDLLPCPFCGGEPEIKQVSRNGVEIKCKNCGIGYKQKTIRHDVEWLTEKMTETWNNRAEKEQPSTDHDIEDMGDGWRHCRKCNKSLKSPEVRNYVDTNIPNLKAYYDELHSLWAGVVCEKEQPAGDTEGQKGMGC